MVSQALTGTAPGPCGSPEPRPATPPVWGSACQITNCDRRRWTLSRTIMSSCKLEIRAKNSFSLIYPFPLSYFPYFTSNSQFLSPIFHIPFQFQIFLSHFISFSSVYFISFQSAASLPEGAFPIQFHPIAMAVVKIRGGKAAGGR